MFSGVPYDTCPSSIYVFTCTIILNKNISINNVLFYNMLGLDIGTV